MTLDELRAYLGFMGLDEIVGYIASGSFPSPCNSVRPHDGSALWDRKEVDAALDIARDSGLPPVHQQRSVRHAIEESNAITPEQCRKARRLLGWNMSQLAAASGTYLILISTYENLGRIAVSREGGSHITSIRTALEAAGIEFTNGGTPGVRLRPVVSGS